MTKNDKDKLLRIVRNCEKIVIVDGYSNINGRGAYICKNKECMEKAIKRKWIPRSLRSELPPCFYDSLREYFKTF